jgi:hypothetical protein
MSDRNSKPYFPPAVAAAGTPTISGPSSTCVRTRLSATIRPNTACPFAFKCVRSSFIGPLFSACPQPRAKTVDSPSTEAKTYG